MHILLMTRSASQRGDLSMRKTLNKVISDYVSGRDPGGNSTAWLTLLGLCEDTELRIYLFFSRACGAELAPDKKYGIKLVPFGDKTLWEWLRKNVFIPKGDYLCKLLKRTAEIEEVLRT